MTDDKRHFLLRLTVPALALAISGYGGGNSLSGGPPSHPQTSQLSFPHLCDSCLQTAILLVCPLLQCQRSFRYDPSAITENGKQVRGIRAAEGQAPRIGGVFPYAQSIFRRNSTIQSAIRYPV